jgi:hypothetical protein
MFRTLAMIGAVASMALLATADPPQVNPTYLGAISDVDLGDLAGQAPGVYAGPDAHEAVMRCVFDLTGDRADLFDPDDGWNMILDEPIRNTVGDDTVTGYHLALGDMFSVTTPVIITIPGDELSDEFWIELEGELGDDFDDLVDLSFHFWMGTMSSASASDVPCGGLAVTWTFMVDGVPEEFGRISPLATWHDWAYGLDIIYLSEDFNAWAMEMHSMCDMQDAEYDSCINSVRRDGIACFDKIKRFYNTIGTSCFGGGIASCIVCGFIPPGNPAGCGFCIASIPCVGGAAAKLMAERSVANVEWARAMECCCDQAKDRHNGIPPTGDCNFQCPR